MRTKATLGLKPQQSLRITPGVQLALKFLQIPALELRAWVDQEILSNPLLEIEEEDESSSTDSASNTDTDSDSDGTQSEIEADPPEWPEFLPNENEVPLPRGMRERPEGDDLQPVRTAIPSMGESIVRQLRLAYSDPVLLRVGEYLTGCLDDRGYLGCPLGEVAAELDVSIEEVRQALEVIQGLEPSGIGARDLRECLLLQLHSRGRTDSVAWRIVEKEFDLLSSRRLTALSRRLRVPIGEIESAIDEIRLLKPHPGRLVAPDEVRYIYPDLILTRVGDRFEVFPSDRSVPRLRVSSSYRSILDGSAESDVETAEYVRGRLRSARWLVQALDRRRDTMLRVMRAIIEEQSGFLERGTAALKPLTLQTIARRVGMHESTVARVTKSKYVQTPRGIFPLKFFFSGRIQTQLGEDTSSRAVREKIRGLIENEDIQRPLSDAAIARTLEGEGIRIARRTVAKYRDRMGIERAQRRRRHRDGSSVDSGGARSQERRRIA